MRKVHELPRASDEISEDPGEEGSAKLALAKRLEGDGHQVLAVGRALVTIERSEAENELPHGVGGWGTLRLSFYPDPDVVGSDDPQCLYLTGGRYGFTEAYLESPAANGTRRLEKLEPG